MVGHPETYPNMIWHYIRQTS